MARACAVLSLLALSFAIGCAQSHDLDRGVGGPDDGAGPGGQAGNASAALGTCEEQAAGSIDGLPDDLACLGLYLDVAKKTVAKNARPYAPAYFLWSDGAEKERWIQLPEGEKIDASAPKDWIFPVGTTFYKEFSADGQRIETRVYRKDRNDHWDKATYKWNARETAARRSEGEDLPNVELGGQPYRIPSTRDCNLCHDGREDSILGFEAVSLGLDGAQGITLQDLVDEDLIEPAPEETHYSIGDDGTTQAAKALGWLHINCGASCHNDNTDSEAYSSGLRLELDPGNLDGRRANELEIVTTTVGINAKTLRWAAQKRIVPGSPETSLLYKLASFRGGGKNDQMPPVASKIIDPEYLEIIEDWIRRMPAGQRVQTGVQ